MSTCSKCKSECFFIDVSKSKDIKELFGGPCDLCRQVFCRKCTLLSSNKIRVLTAPNKTVSYYCPKCVNTIHTLVKELPKMKKQINDLHSESHDLKRKLNSNAQPMPKLSPTQKNFKTRYTR